jgi:hypothetical protein
MAQILVSIPNRWHVVYSAEACTVTDAQGNPYCSVAAGGSAVFWCVGKQVSLSSDSARMYPLTEDVSGVFARFTPGERVHPLHTDTLKIQHATWFNNTEQSVIAVKPGVWANRVLTCYLKTDIPVALSGVTWLYGEPFMDEGYTYVIALQQISSETVLANLAYSLKQ